MPNLPVTPGRAREERELASRRKNHPAVVAYNPALQPADDSRVLDSLHFHGPWPYTAHRVSDGRAAYPTA